MTRPIFSKPGSGTGPYVTTSERNYDVSPDGQRFIMLKDSLLVVEDWFEELNRLAPASE